LSANDVTKGVLLLAASAAAVWMLRQSWRTRSHGHLAFMLAGWGVAAIAIIAAANLFGPARGTAIAIMTMAVAAFIVIASGRTLRPSKQVSDQDVAPEPSTRGSRAWRGWLRALLAGPIGGLAAMGVAIAWTVWLPADPQTRIVTGGLLQPVLWGGAMAWTLADDKILRATAVLITVAAVTFALSALKGFGA
jgi:hypothetical protein